MKVKGNSDEAITLAFIQYGTHSLHEGLEGVAPIAVAWGIFVVRSLSDVLGSASRVVVE